MNTSIKEKDYKTLISLCNKKCLEISINSKEAKYLDLEKLRGEYKGFMYLKKTLLYFKNQRKVQFRYSLYNHIKNEKNNMLIIYNKVEFFEGISKSLIFFMNELGSLNDRK